VGDHRCAVPQRRQPWSIAPFTTQLQELALLTRRQEGRVHRCTGESSAAFGAGRWRRGPRVGDGRGRSRDRVGRPTARHSGLHVRLATARISCSSTTSCHRQGNRADERDGAERRARLLARRQMIAFERNSRELRVIDSGDRMKKSSSRPVCRHAAVRRRARLRVVARLAVHRLSDAGAPDVSECARRVPVASGVPSFIAGEGRAVSFPPTPTPDRWRGVPTVRI